MTNQEAIDYLMDPTGKGLEAHEEAVAMAVSALRNQPRPGHWIECGAYANLFTSMYTCSVCGRHGDGTPYCPNCGAKMGEDDGSD